MQHEEQVWFFTDLTVTMFPMLFEYCACVLDVVLILQGRGLHRRVRAANEAKARRQRKIKLANKQISDAKGRLKMFD